MCPAVIQTEFTMLTINPCKKYFDEHFVAMMYAQIINIASQQKGSTLEEIKYTVAKAIAKPNKESLKIKFQFICREVWLQIQCDQAHLQVILSL